MFLLEHFNERAFQYYANLQRVKKYAEEHYSEAITLERISQVACLEAKYFSKVFHKRAGITFTSWLSYIRIKEALKRISASDCSISEIAGDVGFEDLRTFERAFKRLTGRTPREFKNSVRP
jgi:two-component system, response regulator YesN